MEGYDFDFGGNRKRKRQRKKKLIGWIFFCIEIGAVILLAYLLVKTSLDRTKMPGNGMEPTLAEDTIIVINKMSYRLHAPKRYDVIVFDREEKEHSFYYVMRVIGLPGETIQIKEGCVYINGTELEEPVNGLEEMQLFGLAEKPLTLEEDEYFVLGDNRNKSEDSRFANIGTVKSHEIIGKAWLTEKPFHIISLKNQNRMDSQ